MVDLKRWIDKLLTAPSPPVGVKTAWITFMLQLPFVVLLRAGLHGHPISTLFFSPASSLIHVLLFPFPHAHMSDMVANISILFLQSVFLGPLVFWILTRERRSARATVFLILATLALTVGVVIAEQMIESLEFERRYPAGRTGCPPEQATCTIA